MTITEPNPTTRRTEPEDHPEVNRVLAAAFLDDPVFAWITPSRATRQAILPTVFDGFTRAFARHRATDAVPAADGTTLAGVALWAPPGVAPVHPEDEPAIEAGLDGLDPADLERFAICMEVFEAAHPAEPAWFLNFLAVDPSYQGQGVGSTLLSSVLAVADAAGDAAHLEATSLRNRALYERHGFRCIGDLVLPGGPTTYAMWRDPA